MKEDKLEPFTDFYRKIVFADKVFDVNFQEIARVLFNEVDRLNSIIKEVREFIEWHYEDNKNFYKNKGIGLNYPECDCILEILDKEI